MESRGLEYSERRCCIGGTLNSALQSVFGAGSKRLICSFAQYSILCYGLVSSLFLSLSGLFFLFSTAEAAASRDPAVHSQIPIELPLGVPPSVPGTSHLLRGCAWYAGCGNVSAPYSATKVSVNSKLYKKKRRINSLGNSGFGSAKSAEETNVADDRETVLGSAAGSDN